MKTTALVLATLLVMGCGQRQLSGVVQGSQLTQGRYVLFLGTSEKSDYVFVDAKVLLDIQGILAVQKDTYNVLLLGDRYVGKRVRVSGEIARDQSGRRYIHVTRKEQIELR